MFAAFSVQLGTKVFHHYGYGLFVGVPLAIGFLTAHLAQRAEAWNWNKALRAALLAAAFTGACLFLPMVEGVACLLMAAVVALPFVLVGVLIARTCIETTTPARRRTNTKLHSLVLILVPASMALESRVALPPPILEQSTSIEINATPEQVWRYIPAFPRIEAAPTKLLRAGLAYPMASTLTGEGVGAKRQCVLSTGIMPEVITAWEPGKRLEFDVLATPSAMKETNPFGDVKAAHDEGYFTCRRGRFVLTALPNGRTQVEGTSWFQHDLWPQFYWAPLTKEVVHEVHERVLLHIKTLAEKGSPERSE
ncbi:MAG: uncharacterized protein JWO94_3108 [Verrucomicrobiaceae bacterium]|nr:uncharacterized protein [Verrucomicrobiaceae bacterium]